MDRKNVIEMVRSLGITPEELGFEPVIKEVRVDDELIAEMKEFICDYDDNATARDYFNEKYWGILGIQKKEYKVIVCTMEKTIYKDIKIIMPENVDTCDVDDYIHNIDSLDNDDLSDEGDWRVCDYEDEENYLTIDDIEENYYYAWNYDEYKDIDN